MSQCYVAVKKKLTKAGCKGKKCHQYKTKSCSPEEVTQVVKT